MDSTTTTQVPIDNSQSHHELALKHWKHSQQSGEREELEKSIDHGRAALVLCPEGHPDRSKSLVALATSLSARYEQGGNTGDLDEAIKLHHAALDLCPKDDPYRSVPLSRLAASLRSRFEQHEQIADIDVAIQLHHTTLNLCPEDHPNHYESLTQLASSLQSRFDKCGQVEDLDEAVKLCRTALTRGACPKGHIRCPKTLNNLANALRKRPDQNGQIKDLNEAIELYRAALEFYSKDHPMSSVEQGNLASALTARFRHYGMTEDIDEAIELHRTTIRLLSSDHPFRHTFLSNLADSLECRFEQRALTRDLDEAIELQYAALEICPKDHIFRHTCLRSLASSLSARFKQLKRSEDLDKAIELDYAALELCPEGHPKRSLSLHNLAVSLGTRFGECKRAEDLDGAIEMFRAALELRRDGHPLRSSTLSNLAYSLQVRFERYGQVEDLDEAIRLLRSALELLPEGHPERYMSQKTLATSLHTRVHHQWCAEEFEECIQLLKLAATDKLSGLLQQLRTAHVWAFFARSHNHSSALSAYKLIILLLQHAVTVSPTLHGQHDFLIRNTHHRTLTMEAASYAIEKNMLKEAVEMLEQGRGLLWSQLRGLRTPLDYLAEVNKELVDRFGSVNWKLENLATSHEASGSGSAMKVGGLPVPDTQMERKPFDELLGMKKKLSDEQEEILSEIRQIPGFELFLEATPFKTLQKAASEGPVIMVNHCQYRSDALIILPRDDLPVVCVPLDKDFYEDSFKLSNDLSEIRRCFGTASPRYDEKLHEVMKMLWDKAVSKVVDKLKELCIAEGTRIWWCPTSVLTSLPFHAAGPYEDANGTKKYLLDDYVSSYTPTLGALINARKDSAREEPTVLVIGDLRDTSGLRSALQEIKNIRNTGMRTKRIIFNNEKQISRAKVTKALRETKWVHFVCHGLLGSNPFDSSFHLSDGGLTLFDIVQRDLPNAEFAFLSACHTAEQPQHGAHDEVLHLAAAMQFSGFRSVIGSMWALLDEDGPHFARAVYGYINDCEEGEVNYKRAAAGLRNAALELKARDEIAAERWVNLVHIGA